MKRMIKASEDKDRVTYLIEKISPHVGYSDIVDFITRYFRIEEDAIVECLEDLADRLVIDIEEDQEMKRWVHAKRDIEYKTRDYIAAWAKDDVKSGNPVATFRDFEDEMKSKGLKADRDDYDYYIQCYNNAVESSKSEK